MEYTKEQLEKMFDNLTQSPDANVRRAVALQGYGIETLLNDHDPSVCLVASLQKYGLLSSETAKNIHIRELDLSFRTYNPLVRAGFETVQDLLDKADFSSDEPFEFLQQVRSLGLKGCDEVFRAVLSYGERIETKNSEKKPPTGIVEDLLADATERSKINVCSSAKAIVDKEID